jgi:hypothetical protein
MIPESYVLQEETQGYKLQHVGNNYMLLSRAPICKSFKRNHIAHDLALPTPKNKEDVRFNL